MQHITFEPSDTYKVALLIKSSGLRKPQLQQHYVDPLVKLGVPASDVIAFDLQYIDNKAPAKLQKAYLEDLLRVLSDDTKTEYLFIADPAYFKTLTKQRKSEPHYGYLLPCAIKGYEHLKVMLVPNYQALLYTPEIQQRIDLSLNKLASVYSDTYVELGQGIIHSAKYLYTASEAATELLKLHQYKELTCDVEAFSLNFWETGIATITFCWDQHNGIAICCDLGANEPAEDIRTLLRVFFDSYTGTLIYHGAMFDLKIIISSLYMDNLLDEKGKQHGIQVMTRNFHCTMIITYLATNSTGGNSLGLKDQSHEFAGNYAKEDINDITKIPLIELMEYNLVDGLATWYVFNKNFEIMLDDLQLSVYEEIMKPSVSTLLQVELTGMPLCMKSVAAARKELEADVKRCKEIFHNSKLVNDFVYNLKEQTQIAANEKLVKKVKPLSDFDYIEFNPNSNPQMQSFLYETLGLPVIDTTKSGAPSSAGDTLKKLVNHTNDPHILEILQTLNDFADADKMLTTFITAFERAVLKDDGCHYLHGSFKIGGTVSGRLSCSNPNLQTIPSTGTKYAKIIKKCFVAPPGYVFMGADFASLEDRISALTTRDPNKLKVYLDGYDGHCLRAYYYFNDQFVGITEDVQGINSIKKLFPELRQKSKAPTFLLTYGGTYHGLMNNCGLSKEEAKKIEDNYHKLYAASDQWVQDKILQASKDGFVTVAFGLRVRTPLLKKCIMNNRRTPYEAQAEARTAGNALGQSYGLLNNRAGNELQQRTFKSKYRYDILPVAHIHDAQYFMVKDDVDVVEWLNRNLVDCMEWQGLPEIYHPAVGLGGELSLFYPTWANDIEIPNNASIPEIRQVIQKALAE